MPPAGNMQIAQRQNLIM